MARIPGQKAKHTFITDACRSGRGDMGAFDEAMERLRAEYASLLAKNPKDHDIRYHLVLTIDWPERRKS